MKALSKIAAGVSPSATLAVSALAKKMKAEGKDVIGFGAGEPDFATPDRISYAGVRAICDGKTRYTPAAGMIELRQAICRPHQGGLRSGVRGYAGGCRQRRQAHGLYCAGRAGRSGR